MDADLTTQYAAAVITAKGVPTKSLSNETKLMIYSLYKQADVGPCNTERPGIFDQVGRTKWDSWKQLGDMSKEDAMRQYIEVVNAAYV
ncbi:putative acyl-CoA-binding protein [Ochromonadaceae sp. CCMP2298]|nr:putative acyl-CoA-binding protein [Ochromonadaceae sp. CCMP2298]|mmetsp:Transcript_32122/g.70784  ORF Transcript_32122/g.70784 Transcript_32122/m.70784 type:complete len:88 (-) Transcript_32122:81-344(-)|eukprot:CAMPEP_0173195514 /NCGR_PEP_ID=MMETSP1141-20130122/15100_1 /TAXON_ID=483371 /ORGANISM="non described non described, Strain CCMP2298" /LENGTH=87 /DNA_ID=CAMNT_0014120057 /DNA_START=44 /DNA_END=307 /DNA_ORIENTATION=+